MLRRWLLQVGLPWSSYLGYPVGTAVRFLRDSEHWTREQIAEHQGRALNALMHHCYKNVPYYQEVMRSRNLRPDDFQSPGDVAALPYLTRDIIRAQGARLRAANYPERVCQFRRSGGTTGEPIRVAADARARALETAAYMRGFGWMGYKLGQPMLRLFGGSLGFGDRTLKTTIREWLLNSRFLPAFDLGPANVEDYARALRKSTGGILVGYASAVYNLAEYMSRRSLGGSGLASVICTAEFMPEQWRARIRQVLEAPVFCYYGCGEVNGLGYECEGEEGYIVPQEHVILEAEGNNPEEFRDEGSGQACITTLFNYAMPLVRYLNSDVLELRYPRSGRSHLRITRLEGRVMDQLLASDGHTVSSALPPHLVYRSGIPVWKYQVVQDERDHIVFHYLLPDEQALPGMMQNQLTEVFQRFLGRDLRVEFAVGGFEVPPSGKHRLVINRVAVSEAVAARQEVRQ